MGRVIVKAPKLLFDNGFTFKRFKVNRFNFVATAEIYPQTAVFVEVHLTVGLTVFGQLFKRSFSVGLDCKPVLVAAYCLANQQCHGIRQPFYFQDTLTGRGFQLFDKFSFHVRNKQFSTRDEGHFLVVGGHIKGGDVAAYLKILPLGKRKIANQIEFDGLGHFGSNVINPRLIVFFKHHFTSVGAYLRAFDGFFE